MQVFRIENNLSQNFKSRNVSSVSLKTYAKFKESLYSDIDSFLKQKISKEDYLKSFNTKVNKIFTNGNLSDKLTLDEKLFISDVKTSIDLADSIKSISDKELSARMNELLKNKNSVKNSL